MTRETASARTPTRPAFTLIASYPLIHCSIFASSHLHLLQLNVSPLNPRHARTHVLPPPCTPRYHPLEVRDRAGPPSPNPRLRSLRPWLGSAAYTHTTCAASPNGGRMDTSSTMPLTSGLWYTTNRGTISVIITGGRPRKSRTATSSSWTREH